MPARWLDIVTPPESYLDLIALGASRGIAMVCQKPLAHIYPEAERVSKAAERAEARWIAAPAAPREADA